MSRARQQDEAIRVHSAQASLFSARYDALSGDPFTSCFTYSRRQLQRYLDQLLPTPDPRARLLDVGCGTGHHLAWGRGRGFATVGVDGSEAMLREARRLDPGADLRQAEVDALPFAAEVFDAVLCIEVLRYLPDTGPCIREMARVLKPGGTCLATASPLFNLNGFPALNRLPLLVPWLRAVRLKQYFHTSVGLRRVFRRAGFTRASVHGVYLGPINWIERAFPHHLPAFLRWFEPYDRLLADLPGGRDVSAMLLVHAVR